MTLPVSDTNASNSPWPLGVNAAFLTPAEQSFFGVLKLLVQDRYMVFPKVNLNDVVFIRKGTEPGMRQSIFNQISRKHLDFLIADPQSLAPICAIELDDSSHQLASSSQRDQIKNKALNDAGLRLIRFPVKPSYNLAEMEIAFANLGISFLTAEALSSDVSNNAVSSDSSDSLHAGSIDSAQGVVSQREPVCPKCNTPMILRKARSGANTGSNFYGCTNFPKCREIIQSDPV